MISGTLWNDIKKAWFLVNIAVIYAHSGTRLHSPPQDHRDEEKRHDRWNCHTRIIRDVERGEGEGCN